MAWTNIFALGDCSVRIYHIMTDAWLTEADWITHGITVEVAADGAVTVERFESSLAGYVVMVVPAFDTAGDPVRVSGFSSTSALNLAGTFSEVPVPIDYQELSGALDAWTPDPVDALEPAAWYGAGVAMEMPL